MVEFGNGRVCGKGDWLIVRWIRLFLGDLLSLNHVMMTANESIIPWVRLERTS